MEKLTVFLDHLFLQGVPTEPTGKRAFIAGRPGEVRFSFDESAHDREIRTVCVSAGRKQSAEAKLLIQSMQEAASRAGLRLRAEAIPVGVPAHHPLFEFKVEALKSFYREAGFTLKGGALVCEPHEAPARKLKGPER